MAHLKGAGEKKPNPPPLLIFLKYFSKKWKSRGDPLDIFPKNESQGGPFGNFFKKWKSGGTLWIFFQKMKVRGDPLDIFPKNESQGDPLDICMTPLFKPS